MLVVALFCIYAILVTVSGSVLDIPSTKLNKPNQSSKDVKQRDIIDKSPAKSRQEKEQLFEAYNLLHTLAQVCIVSVDFYHVSIQYGIIYLNI